MLVTICSICLYCLPLKKKKKKKAAFRVIVSSNLIFYFDYYLKMFSVMAFFILVNQWCFYHISSLIKALA